MDFITQIREIEAPTYGVWGHPIAHSLSPIIHNGGFADHQINATYQAFDIPPSKLVNALDLARQHRLGGWNVTIPHKIAIMPLLDTLTDRAQIGAVNTVYWHHDQLVGDNTDGAGFVSQLFDQYPRQAIDRALILGAGGSARSVAFALLQSGTSTLTIANRTLETAEQLVKDLSVFFPEAEIQATKLAEPIRHQDQPLDLLVQTTSRGLNTKPIEVEWTSLGEPLVADLVYGETATAFLNEAHKFGLTTFDGIYMLVGQAALAFEIWTGKKLNITNTLARLRT